MKLQLFWIQVFYLINLVLSFKAGCVKDHIDNWRSVTTDLVILDAVKHHHIEFEGRCRPVQATKPRQITFSSGEKEIISTEITKLLSKGVIELTNSFNGDFLSTIFVRPKKDGSYRLILNLKPLNEFVSYYHFKMDTIQTALKLMRPGCFMASFDLKDAYYSIPIAAEDRQLLKFEWEGNYFHFTCLPNELASAPILFTKVLKPVIANLRVQGPGVQFGELHYRYLEHNKIEALQANKGDYDAFMNLSPEA